MTEWVRKFDCSFMVIFIRLITFPSLPAYLNIEHPSLSLSRLDLQSWTDSICSTFLSSLFTLTFFLIAPDGSVWPPNFCNLVFYALKNPSKTVHGQPGRNYVFHNYREKLNEIWWSRLARTVLHCYINNSSLKNQYPVDRYPYSLDCFLSLSLSLIAERKISIFWFLFFLLHCHEDNLWTQKSENLQI